MTEHRVVRGAQAFNKATDMAFEEWNKVASCYARAAKLLNKLQQNGGGTVSWGNFHGEYVHDLTSLTAHYKEMRDSALLWQV